MLGAFTSAYEATKQNCYIHPLKQALKRSRISSNCQQSKTDQVMKPGQPDGFSSPAGTQTYVLNILYE